MDSTWFKICKMLVQKFDIPVHQWFEKSKLRGIMKTFQHNFCATYTEKFFIEIESCSKLGIYQKVKKLYKLEPYLCHIKNVSSISALTKMRLSAHKLPIERLRGMEERINRLCVACDQGLLVMKTMYYLNVPIQLL